MIFNETFQKEMILDKLHEIPWHLMVPEHQKMIAHAMSRLQNGATIRMGPLAELNYSTFARVSSFEYIFMEFRENFHFRCAKLFIHC